MYPILFKIGSLVSYLYNANLLGKIELKIKSTRDGIKFYLFIFLIILIPIINSGCGCPPGEHHPNIIILGWDTGIEDPFSCEPDNIDYTGPTPFDFFITPIEQNTREIQDIYYASDKTSAKNAWNYFVNNMGYISVNVGDGLTEKAYDEIYNKITNLNKFEKNLTINICKGIYRNETPIDGYPLLKNVTKISPFSLNPKSTAYGITQFLDSTTKEQFFLNKDLYSLTDVVDDIGQKLADISSKEGLWDFLSKPLKKDPRSDNKKCLAMAMLKFNFTVAIMNENGYSYNFQFDRSSVQILSAGHMAPGIVVWVFKNNNGIWDIEKLNNKNLPKLYTDVYSYAKRVEIFIFGGG